MTKHSSPDAHGPLGPRERRARQRRERASARPWPDAARPRVRAGHRVFFHEDGEPIFGPGISDLLVLVQETGSLHAAAHRMGMSYNKAWHVVRMAEDRLRMELLSRRTGGQGGGGSVLTDAGVELVRRFRAFLDDADADLDRLYFDHFGDLPFAQPEPRADGEAQSA